MATSSLSLSLLPPFLTSISTSKPRYFYKTCNSSLTLNTIPHSKRTNFNQYPLRNFSQRSALIWRISAVSDEILPSEAPIEQTQQLISTDEGGGSTVISVLLFIAFVGLTVLTLGVIYLALSDFFQKREREKLEKEDASKKKKKSGKKGKVRAKTGPKGFGQKIEDEDFDE